LEMAAPIQKNRMLAESQSDTYRPRTQYGYAVFMPKAG
jgi:hypothetical protein